MNIEWKIPMNSFKVPRIRFKRFDSVWVENRIADIVKISAGGDVDKERLKESGKYPVIANALTKKGIVGFYDNFKVKAPAVTVTGRGDVGYAVARHENFTPIVRLLTLQSENIDVDYLENQINSMRILNESTGVPQLTAPQLGNYKVYHPEIEEQSAIGSLFRTLDELLASYKDNLSNYQALKATMLSKMFPKAGQTVPEIRLDGFEGEWRIIKLGDVLSELKSGLSRELSNDDIGLPVIRANNISDGNLNLDRDMKYWFKDDPKGANTANYFVRENDILVNFINSEAKMGTAAIVLREPDRETIYTTNILKLTVKEDYYPYFIYLMTFVQSYQNYIKAITKPAVNQASFTTVDFKKYEFLCPAFQEQQAISAYFLNLDNLINSHQEKISQLETLKKKLLQDMFI